MPNQIYMVTGPTGSTQYSIARWKDTTGDVLDDSVITISNIGVLSTPYIQMTNNPTNGYILTCDVSGNGTWQPFAGVTAPNSVVNNSVCLFNGTNGRAIKSSLVSINSTGGILAPSIQLQTGATNGYFLSSDASGNATWKQILKGPVTTTLNTIPVWGATNGYTLTSSSASVSSSGLLTVSSIRITSGAHSGYILASDGVGNGVWVNLNYVGGPVSSSNRAVAIFNGTSGGTLMNSAMILSTNNVLQVNGVNINGSGGFQMASGAHTGYVLSCDNLGVSSWIQPLSGPDTATTPYTLTMWSDDSGKNLTSTSVTYENDTLIVSKLQLTFGAYNNAILMSDGDGNCSWGTGSLLQAPTSTTQHSIMLWDDTTGGHITDSPVSITSSGSSVDVSALSSYTMTLSAGDAIDDDTTGGELVLCAGKGKDSKGSQITLCVSDIDGVGLNTTQQKLICLSPIVVDNVSSSGTDINLFNIALASKPFASVCVTYSVTLKTATEFFTTCAQICICATLDNTNSVHANLTTSALSSAVTSNTLSAVVTPSLETNDADHSIYLKFHLQTAVTTKAYIGITVDNLTLNQLTF